MKPLLCLLILIAFSLGTFAQKKIRGIDVYGTSQITLTQVKQKLGAKIEEFAKQFPDGPELGKLYGEIGEGIFKMGNFGYVNISITIHPDDLNGIYFGIDLVDKKDQTRRMNFLPAPDKEFSDPEGLIAAWLAYEKQHGSLFLAGNLKTTGESCPALHCINDFSHPSLKPYLENFQTNVPRNKTLLVQILRGEKNAEHRAAAAFLLAHITDATELVKILEPSISDASSGVRNNVMRVLMDISNRQKDVAINITPLIKALDYPDSSDRNKALYTLVGLADRPENKSIIRQQAGETILKILRLTQPNNHAPAYEILKKISGEKYGDRDYARWTAWLKKANKRR